MSTMNGAIMFKGCIRPIINSMNADFFYNYAQVYYLRPLASSMDRSHFAWHLDHRITQKPSNFHHTPDPPTQEGRNARKADNHTHSMEMLQIQMKVIKG